MIRLLVADNHTISRVGVCALIAAEKDIEIAGEATSTTELMTLIHSTQVDVILMDVGFDNHRSVEIIVDIKANFPEICIVAFTRLDEKAVVIDLLKAGSDGFLLKSAGKEDMLTAIRTVASGDSYLCHEVSLMLLQLLSPSSENHTATYQDNIVTNRETEVLRLIAEEYTNSEIAGKLFISLSTVDTHRRHLLKKLRVKNTAGLVKYAIRQGII